MTSIRLIIHQLAKSFLPSIFADVMKLARNVVADCERQMKRIHYYLQIFNRNQFAERIRLHG